MDANKQKEVLNNFILEFLPKRGNERKYSTNEIDYVTKTIEWVCMKFFDFRPTEEEVLHSFKMLGYRLLEKKDDNCFKGKRKDGKNILTKYMYVDIDSVMVKQLRNVTKKLQPNTGKEKEYKYFLLKSRLEEFKIKHDIS